MSWMTTPPAADAFYLADGDGFIATLCTQGGWHPRHQHGGPVQALLARAIERLPSLVPMQVARLTHDLFRPVPIGPRLSVDASILREGKRIQVAEAVLRVGEVEHARCRAIRLREEDLSGTSGLGPNTVDDNVALPDPDGLDGLPFGDAKVRPGFLDGIDLRRFPRPDGPEGVWGYWVRLLVPLLADEVTTPLQTLSVAGDFANMIGATFDATKISAINPDLNVHLLRPPRGEWLAVMGDWRAGAATGIGVSTATIRDRDGVCAVAANCQLLQPR